LIPEIHWTTEKSIATGEVPSSPSQLAANVSEANTELRLRGEFFREQWEVCGPGQLAGIVRWIGLQKAAPITVRWTFPGPDAKGGCVSERECWCPAVLHDNVAGFSEVVRVTWMIATALVRQARQSGNDQDGNCVPDVPDDDFLIPADAIGMVAALASAANFGLILQEDSISMQVLTAARHWGIHLTEPVELWATKKLADWSDTNGWLSADLWRKCNDKQKIGELWQ
jgi:hypothetical protein